ncbi:MAG: glycerol-3-phosphate acyltransferase [Candidatus Yanofskybacteria bacterium]|nr:glycerol-3-phosphate acyltransferase [Candidatus Yanofskybacteria bacterium]
MNIVIFLGLGYLLGSLSPGYFFGRVIKSVDLREVGKNKNTGASNTYREVGPVYGVITGIFDALKAATAYFIAVKGLILNPLWINDFASRLSTGINPDVAILIGLAAVAGHVFPFYLNFRGGRGVASLYGLNLIVWFHTLSVFALFLFITTIFYTIAISQRPEIKKVLSEAPVRKFLKLTALVLPLGYLVVSQKFLLVFVGVLLVVSLVLDGMRFILPALNRRYLALKSLAKTKELKRLSGYTFFLASAFAIFWVFPKEIVVISLSFFIIGDVFAPLGLVFMAKETIKGKTIGGAVLIFILCLITGIFLRSLAGLDLSLNFMIIAALSTAILDQFSFLIDDNLLVPIGTAIILTLVF